MSESGRSVPRAAAVGGGSIGEAMHRGHQETTALPVVFVPCSDDESLSPTGYSF
jgi:hypothetical protein